MEDGFEICGCPSWAAVADPKAGEGVMSRFNGKYWKDGKASQGKGFAHAYKREGDGANASVIELCLDSKCWRIGENYAPPFYYYNFSQSDTPPLDGWTVGDAVSRGCKVKDRPTLKPIQRKK